MKIFCYKLRKAEAGFSLAEMIGALVIGAMVMVSVLAIYQRAESSVSAISRKLDGDRLGTEVLQLIAEDLDRLTTAGKDVKITIANKLDNLYPTARMVILKIAPGAYTDFYYRTSNIFKQAASPPSVLSLPRIVQQVIKQGSYPVLPL